MIHKSYQMVALRPSPPIRRPSALKPKKPNVGFKSVGVSLITISMTNGGPPILGSMRMYLKSKRPRTTCFIAFIGSGCEVRGSRS